MPRSRDAAFFIGMIVADGAAGGAIGAGAGETGGDGSLRLNENMGGSRGSEGETRAGVVSR